MLCARATVVALKRNLNIFSAPIKSGQLLPGVSKAPSILIRDLVPALECSKEYGRVNLFDVAHKPEDHLKNAILSNSEFEDIVLTLGGDHLTEYYSIAAQLERYGSHNTGVVWVDTHTDINTKETSLSGSEHGMVVAGLLGMETGLRGVGVTDRKNCLRPHNIVYVGTRDMDPMEEKIIRSLGIRVYTSQDVHERGVADVMNQALYNDLAHTEFIHMSYDVDVIDPDVFPCTGTPVSGGLSYEQSIDIADAIRGDLRLVSMGLVEFNPDLAPKADWCGAVATDIILSSLAYNPYRY